MSRRFILTAVGALTLAGASFTTAATAAPSQVGITHRNVRVCGTPAAGSAECTAWRHDTYVDGKPKPNATPSGYGPSDLQSAYHLAGLASGGKMVAIVDAYDDPSAEKDLGVYRSQFGLSPCTTANGCFKKVNQSGGTKYPRANGGWAQEISLDLDMVSAICPDCRILLVEASSSSFSNLATAVAYAANHGAVAISNSYGGSDSSNISAYETAAAKSIAVTASTGDSGYGTESPASFTHVVAVGGTSLQGSMTTGWTETAWSGAGSGCSTHNANPGWQSTVCGSYKANADVSAVADPNTGVAVYDSTSYQGMSGWMVFGGTSVASPIVASVYALAGNFGTYAGEYTWGHLSALNDVTSGSNGSCSPSVLCNAGTGWDGPTGLGTPNGTGSF